MAAFAAQDRKGNGLISAKDFKAIMCNSGEKVSSKLSKSSSGVDIVGLYRVKHSEPVLVCNISHVIDALAQYLELSSHVVVWYIEGITPLLYHLQSTHSIFNCCSGWFTMKQCIFVIITEIHGLAGDKLFS